MNSETEKARDRNPIRIFGFMIPSLPSLIFRLGGTFLRFKRDAKKAGKVFYKELIKQGFDKKTAADLTEFYLKGSNLIQYIQAINKIRS